MIVGIDEAGRGPVIGPLVVAAVALAHEDDLHDLPVKDSKLLSPKQREVLFDAIKAKATVAVEVITPEQIDHTLTTPGTNLNWLEADAMIRLLQQLHPKKAYLDCPSMNVEAFAQYIKRKLPFSCAIVVEHKADAKYPIVSAASIIAKVLRDREIRAIKKRYNIEFGSGYPSDPLTQKFLKEHYNDYPIFRKSWQSWKNAKQKDNQQSLSHF